MYHSQPTGLPSFWQAGQQCIRNQLSTQSPVPPAGEAEMRQHLGVWGKAPAGAGQRPAARPA